MPCVAVGSGGGKVDDEPADRSFDLGSELEQQVAQGGDLARGESGPEGVEPDLLEEHVDSTMSEM